MNATTKKLLIFGGIVAVIIIIIALKKKQDTKDSETPSEDTKDSETPSEDYFPSLGLVPSSLVGSLQLPGSEDNSDDEIETGSQSLVTATVSKQPGTTRGNQYMSQVRNVRGNNFFDRMKC